MLPGLTARAPIVGWCKTHSKPGGIFNRRHFVSELLSLLGFETLWYNAIENMKGRQMKKTRLISILLALIISVADAGQTLTVNGLDTSMPVQVKPDAGIIIEVAGQTAEQKETCSVTCEVGGKLTPLSEPSSTVEMSQQGDYLFTFEDDESSLAVVDLTVDNILDYQLLIFKVSDANAVIFGVDSDAIEAPQPQTKPGPEPNQSLTSNGPLPMQEDTNAPLTHVFARNIYQAPIFLNCPNDVIPSQFTDFTVPAPTDEGRRAVMGVDSYVELQEITESLYLDPNEVYYVPYPPLLIHGAGGGGVDVVIPSGTTIILAEDWDYGIVVFDGANVCFGEPAPKANEPNTPYEPADTNSLVPPVSVLGESGNPFFNNFCGIFIDRTAGTRCKLDNIYLDGDYYAIQADQQLDYPISNIHTFGCYNGILSFGPNKIVNSTVRYYGMWSPEWPYDGYAYEFMSESSDGTIFFGGTDFTAYNCLADDGDYAFTANGSYEPNEPPNFYSRDCVAADSYTGFNCVNGSLGISVICPGLYNNYQNKNFPELPFTDPVYEVNDPFVIDPNDYRVFLDPNSLFVDSGSSISALPGWTTNIDGAPDAGTGDIWPHYQTRGVDRWLKGDLNLDNAVNMNDLVELTSQWLDSAPNSADLNHDQKVNSIDFAILAHQWLLEGTSIGILNPETDETVEPNNVRGYVGITLKNILANAGLVSVYLDNQFIGNLSLDWDDEAQWLGLETDCFSNGWHTIRAVTTSIYGDIINHKPLNVNFNNLLYMTGFRDHFSPDANYICGGFYDGNDTLDAVLTDLYGQTIWSDNYTGPYAGILIPGDTFTGQGFCQLSVAEHAGSGITDKDLTKEFNQADCPASVKMVIVLPNKDVFKLRKPAIIQCAQACNRRTVSWVPLYLYDVTKENLTFLYNRSSVKYVYWCGHANSHVQDVQRTHTECWLKGEMGWSPPYTVYAKRGAFSWTRQTRGSYPALPGNWDDQGFDLWSLGMHNSANKKMVFVDGCLSAKYSDMADAYGAFSLPGQGSLDQIYIGWRQKVLVSTGIMEQIVGNTTQGVRMFWERMGYGDDVYDALYYTYTHGGLGMQEALWGPNGIPDIGNEQEDDNIFLWGNGLIWQMKLQP
jgi:hypothetical protein